jgi:hypothetical protein
MGTKFELLIQKESIYLWGFSMYKKQDIAIYLVLNFKKLCVKKDVRKLILKSGSVFEKRISYLNFYE